MKIHNFSTKEVSTLQAIDYDREESFCQKPIPSKHVNIFHPVNRPTHRQINRKMREIHRIFHIMPKKIG